MAEFFLSLARKIDEAEGKPDYDYMHWQDMVDCFIDYIKEL